MNVFEFADRNVWMGALYLVIIGYFLSQSFRKKYPESPLILGLRLVIMVIPFLRQLFKSKPSNDEKVSKNVKN